MPDPLADSLTDPLTNPQAGTLPMPSAPSLPGPIPEAPPQIDDVPAPRPQPLATEPTPPAIAADDVANFALQLGAAAEEAKRLGLNADTQATIETHALTERADPLQSRMQYVAGMPLLRANNARQAPPKAMQDWINEDPLRAAIYQDKGVDPEDYARFLRVRSADRMMSDPRNLQRGFFEQIGNAYDQGALDTELNLLYGIRASGGGYDADRIVALENRLALVPETDITGWITEPIRMLPQLFSLGRGALKVGTAGAVAGTVVPGIGTLAGGIGGLKVGFVSRSYLLSAGAASRALRDMRSESGESLHPALANAAAIPIGAAVAWLDRLGLIEMGGGVAGVTLRRLTASQIVNRMVTAASKDDRFLALMAKGSAQLLRGSAAEGGTEMLQEFTQMAGEQSVSWMHEALGGEAMKTDISLGRAWDAGVAGFQASFGLQLPGSVGRAGLQHRAAIRNQTWRDNAEGHARRMHEAGLGKAPIAAASLLNQSGITTALSDAQALVDSGLLEDPALAPLFDRVVIGKDKGIDAIRAAAEAGGDIAINAASLLAQVAPENLGRVMPYLSQDPVAVRQQTVEDARKQQAQAVGSPEQQALQAEITRVETMARDAGRPAEQARAVGLLLTAMAQRGTLGKDPVASLQRLIIGREGVIQQAMNDMRRMPPDQAQTGTEATAPKAAPTTVTMPREAVSLSRAIPEPGSGPDILNAMADQGGVRRPGPQETGGEWDAIREGQMVLRGPYARLVGADGLAPDQMAHALESAGIGDGTTVTMWRMVDDALASRRDAREMAPEATMSMDDAIAEGRMSDAAIAAALPDALQDLTDLAAAMGEDDLAIALREEADANGVELEAFDPDEPFTLFQPAYHGTGNSQPYDQRGPQRPRGRILPLPDKTIIELTSRADASTLPHEIAHFYLTELERLGTEPDATPLAAQHWEQVSAWLAEMDDDAKAQEAYARLSLQATHFNGRSFDSLTGDDKARAVGILKQEMFAEGMEKYLLEGRAPSAQLVGAFHRFRRWLMDVYKRATAIGAPLSEKGRAVFQALLSTDVEAEEMGRLYALADMDDAQAQAMGMSQADRERYVDLMSQAIEQAADMAMDRMSKDLGRRITAWRKSGMAALKAEPVFAAMREIRATGQLDARIARDRLPKRLYRAMRRRGLLSKLDRAGMPDSHILKAHGFDSLINFAKAVEAAPSELDYVRAYVRNAMENAKDAQSVEAAIVEAPAFQEAIALSGLFLTRALGGKPSEAQYLLDQAAIKTAARASFKDATAAYARTPRHYIAAMARAMKVERQAAIRGDYAAAERARRQASHQRAMAEESVRFRDMVADMERRGKKWAKAKDGTREEQHLAWLRYLLQRFGVHDAQQSDPSRRVPFVDDGGNQLFPDAMTVIPPWMESTTAEHWRDLSTQQVTELYDTLTELDGRGRALVNDVELWAQDTTENLVRKSVETLSKVKPITPADRATFAGRMRSKIRAGFAELGQMLWMWRAADGNANIRGNKKSGFIEGLFYDSLHARSEQEMGLRERMQKTLSPHLETLTAWMRKQPAQMTELPFPQRLADPSNPHGIVTAWSPDQLLAVLLNLGNDYNREAVMVGYSLSDADVRELMSAVGDEEWDAIQGIWDGVNSLWPQLDAQHYKLNLFHMRKVEANAFVTPSGKTMAGGYYPIAFDPDLDGKTSERTEWDDMRAASAMMNPIAAARSGMTKPRQGTGGKPVLLNLSALSKHMDNTIRYIAYADVIRGLARVSGNGDFKDAFSRAFGGEQYAQIRPWLAGIVRPQMEIRNKLDRAVEWFRNRATTYLLGFNLGSAILQPTSLFPAIQDLGFAKVAMGLTYIFTHPMTAINEAREQSVVLRDRANGFDRDMRQPIGALDVRNMGRLGRMIERGREIALMPLSIVDNLAATATWYAARDQGLSLGMNPDEAVSYANKTIGASQATVRALDQAAIQRSTNGFARMFTMFSTFTMLYGNRQRAYFDAFARGQISVGELVKQNLLDTIVPGLAMQAFYAMIWGIDDDDEPEKEAAGQLLQMYLSGLPILRDMVGAAALASGVVESKRRPGISIPFVETMGKIGMDSGKLASGLLQAMFSPEAAMDDQWHVRMATILAELAGLTTGIPADRAARKLLEGYRQVMEEDGGPLLLLFPDPDLRRKQ